MAIILKHSDTLLAKWLQDFELFNVWLAFYIRKRRAAFGKRRAAPKLLVGFTRSQD